MIPVLSCFALPRHHILTVSLQQSLTSCVIVNVFYFVPTLTSSVISSPTVAPLNAAAPPNGLSHEGKVLLKAALCNLFGFLKLIILFKAQLRYRQAAKSHDSYFGARQDRGESFSTTLGFALVLFLTFTARVTIFLCFLSSAQPF